MIMTVEDAIEMLKTKDAKAKVECYDIFKEGDIIVAIDNYYGDKELEVVRADKYDCDENCGDILAKPTKPDKYGCQIPRIYHSRYFKLKK